MAEINDISLGRMNNGAHFLFVSNIRDRAVADEKIMAKVKALVDALDAAVQEEDANLKLSRKQLLTDDITDADKGRDSLYLLYKRSVFSYDDIYTGEKGEAAKILSQHIKDYDINPKMQLDRETGLLINFIADLEGKFAEQVAKLSLTQLVTELKEANERLRALTLERTNERTTITVGAMKASRKVTDEAYRTLVKMVNALALVEGDADYVSFIDYVNTEIIHYKREVLGQTATSPAPGGSSADGGDGEEAGDDDDTPIEV